MSSPPNKTSVLLADDHPIVRQGGAAAGTAWFLATYVGPAVALKQSPFPRPTNMTLGINYLAVLMVLCWVSALSFQVETLPARVSSSPQIGVLRELVQPFRW